jgi:hypothetical protein
MSMPNVNINFRFGGSAYGIAALLIVFGVIIAVIANGLGNVGLGFLAVVLLFFGIAIALIKLISDINSD